MPDPENPHFGANILLLSLKMLELLPFEVAVGCNANFQIFLGGGGINVKIHHRDPNVILKSHSTCNKLSFDMLLDDIRMGLNFYIFFRLGVRWG